MLFTAALANPRELDKEEQLDYTRPKCGTTQALAAESGTASLTHCHRIAASVGGFLSLFFNGS